MQSFKVPGQAGGQAGGSEEAFASAVAGGAEGGGAEASPDLQWFRAASKKGEKSNGASGSKRCFASCLA